MGLNALEQIKAKLVPGHVYRRANFTDLSSNVDRNLKQLVKEGTLKKLAYGMYSVPKSNEFGETRPDEQSLLKSFLNDDHFVVYNPSQFNSLGLGTTQLYNRRVVFNRKRSGKFNLGGKVYHFYYWREAPKKLTKEFLLVEMLNRLHLLAEDKDEILNNLANSLDNFDLRKLMFASNHYGNMATQKILKDTLSSNE